jgi:predicted DNA-binding protein (MmcQ/YjbR family)
VNIEELRQYCVYKKDTTENFTFDGTILGFKVRDKMFALTDLEGGLSITLKCNPELAIELREHHPEVTVPIIFIRSYKSCFVL